ncbi:hypothetical protein TNCV_609171 [Trichonephila clavipes]|nr:hypothetical protein TNCV_609171 [Trichonephila clavipes]
MKLSVVIPLAERSKRHNPSAIHVMAFILTIPGQKKRMNLPMFRLPTSIEALDALIKKVEEQRACLTPVDSTPKETVPSDTTLNSPSKRTLKHF